jgi:hypothetical protein
MEEAERIAKEEHGSIKLSVISGKGFFLVFCTQKMVSSVPRCGYEGLLSQAGLRAGWALHEQVVNITMIVKHYAYFYFVWSGIRDMSSDAITLHIANWVPGEIGVS